MMRAVTRRGGLIGLAALVTMVSALWMSPGADAQQQRSASYPILTIDSERLFAETAFGRRIADEIEEVRQAVEELAGIGGIGEPQRAAEGDGEQQNAAPCVETPLEGEFFPVALDGAALLRQGDRRYRGCHGMDPK